MVWVGRAAWWSPSPSGRPEQGYLQALCLCLRGGRDRREHSGQKGGRERVSSELKYQLCLLTPTEKSVLHYVSLSRTQRFQILRKSVTGFTCYSWKCKCDLACNAPWISEIKEGQCYGSKLCLVRAHLFCH